MTLHRIVAALGGDLYAGGYRANVPAPRHSSADRSVSLLLTHGRVVIHGFGGADWREVHAFLCSLDFIEADGRLTGAGHAGVEIARPGPNLRQTTAARLWEEGRELDGGTLAQRYLDFRSLKADRSIPSLRQHPRAPTQVYRPSCHAMPALMARISDDQDRLTAVELTYLDPNGRQTSRLRVSRKTVGHVPAGAAVRLAPWASEMLVAEGVVTTLSAMRRFGLPGWALRAADNLAAWTPPPGVRRVLIAADTGAVGLRAAERLRIRLRRAGVRAAIRAPRPMFSDWNAVDVAERDRPPGG